MKDLPLEEKELIYSISFTNSALLNLLSLITKREPEEIGAELAMFSSVHKEPPTIAEGEEQITQLTASRSEVKNGFVFKRMAK